jgi:hypothetical protein
MSDDYTSYFAACMIIRPTVEESRRPIGIKWFESADCEE